MENPIEVIRRVHVPNENACLEIGDYVEAPHCVELRTVDAKSIEWFGKVSVTMQPEYAEALGNALIAAAKEKLANR